MKQTNDCGFTLIEVLISLSLLALAMTLLVSLFSGGMNVWRRSECGVKQEQSMYVAFDKIRRDLHSIQPFKPIPFKGASDKMEFPVIIDLFYPNMQAGEPGRQRYFFDSKSKSLCQSETPYRGMKRIRDAQSCRPVLEGIEKVRFSYLAYNAKSDALSWSSQWSGDSLPVSVKMELEYEDVCREQKSKKQFTIAIPVGPIR